MIRTVDEFITAVGGNKPAAKYFAIRSSAVSMWKERGHIPGRQVLRAMELAQTNGLTLDPRIFMPRKKVKRAA